MLATKGAFVPVGLPTRATSGPRVWTRDQWYAFMRRSGSWNASAASERHLQAQVMSAQTSPPDGPIVAVVGLGYVGLPVAVVFSRRFRTLGFDSDQERIEELKHGHDRTLEVAEEDLICGLLELTTTQVDIGQASFYIVTVPTPIDERQRPDLSHLRQASQTVGSTLSPGDIVVYESTVYPGVTEEICGPILEEASGLVRGVDFFVGYSPERINPGDPMHRFETVSKVVAGEDEETLDTIARMYGSVINAPKHRRQASK